MVKVEGENVDHKTTKDQIFSSEKVTPLLMLSLFLPFCYAILYPLFQQINISSVFVPGVALVKISIQLTLGCDPANQLSFLICPST